MVWSGSMRLPDKLVMSTSPLEILVLKCRLVCSANTQSIAVIILSALISHGLGPDIVCPAVYFYILGAKTQLHPLTIISTNKSITQLNKTQEM